MIFSILYWYVALPLSLMVIWRSYLNYKNEVVITMDCKSKGIAKYHTDVQRAELLKKWSKKSVAEQEVILNEQKKLKEKFFINPQFLPLVMLGFPIAYVFVLSLLGLKYSFFP